jgi:hypothetical protein
MDSIREGRMKTEVNVQRVHAAEERPIRIAIGRGSRNFSAWMTDDEALELAGAIRDAVQAKRNYTESIEVEVGRSQ